MQLASAGAVEARQRDPQEPEVAAALSDRGKLLQEPLDLLFQGLEVPVLAVCGGFIPTIHPESKCKFKFSKN